MQRQKTSILQYPEDILSEEHKLKTCYLRKILKSETMTKRSEPNGKRCANANLTVYTKCINNQNVYQSL